jgi:hypothetical protein
VITLPVLPEVSPLMLLRTAMPAAPSASDTVPVPMLLPELPVVLAKAL